jgi:hypothetical protein
VGSGQRITPPESTAQAAARLMHERSVAGTTLEDVITPRESIR